MLGLMSWTSSDRKWPCPCGAGEVIETRRESDNGYSGDDASWSWACASCMSAYELRPLGKRGLECSVRDKATGAVIFRYPSK
jgi:hypothetical protein